jgi:hypothetical protein
MLDETLRPIYLCSTCNTDLHLTVSQDVAISTVQISTNFRANFIKCIDRFGAKASNMIEFYLKALSYPTNINALNTTKIIAQIQWLLRHLLIAYYHYENFYKWSIHRSIFLNNIYTSLRVPKPPGELLPIITIKSTYNYSSRNKKIDYAFRIANSSLLDPADLIFRVSNQSIKIMRADYKIYLVQFNRVQSVQIYVNDYKMLDTPGVYYKFAEDTEKT